jgi:transcriptional regulator GlxA family with amidase domain
MLTVQAVTAEAVAGALHATGSHDRLQRWLSGGSRVRPAVDYVERNLDTDLSAAALARVCGFSEGHFARVFREELGQTPARFVLDRRIAHAAQRLVFTRNTIEAIAEDTGFADRFHFSRVFAKRMGLPPARYRKAKRV